MASSNRVLAGIEDVPIERQVIVNQAVVEIKKEDSSKDIEVICETYDESKNIEQNKEELTLDVETKTNSNFFGFKVNASLSVTPTPENEDTNKNVESEPESSVENTKQTIEEPAPISTITKRKR